MTPSEAIPVWFEAEDSDRIVSEMNRSGADFVLVSLPTPLQQDWLAEHRAAIEATVVMTGGSYVDHMVDESWPRSWYPDSDDNDAAELALPTRQRAKEALEALLDRVPCVRVAGRASQVVDAYGWKRHGPSPSLNRAAAPIELIESCKRHSALNPRLRMRSNTTS